MAIELTKKGVFESAVLYLYSFVQNPSREAPLEGITERHPDRLSTGTIWVYDGKTVLENAKEKRTIIKPNIGIREEQSVPTLEDLAGLVRSEPNGDVTYFVNTTDKTATKVYGGLRNSDNEVDLEALSRQLPLTYSSYDGHISTDEVGRRTDAAMVNAHLLNSPPLGDGSEVRVVIVGETKYANTDFGKISEFGPKGLLYKEFFFYHAPEHQGPFMDEEKKFLGILREYEPPKVKGGRVQFQSESCVSLGAKGELQYTPVASTIALERAA
ncbi:MAG: hypothetical protein V2A62_02690 [Candidatus Woesearchaeota archaeon]